jgi:anti-sigma factor RsiW
MSDHLSPTVLNALADGELSGEQLILVHEHLADCPRCTSSALAQSLLKSATARAGHRYTPPPELRARLERQASPPQPAAFDTVRPAWGIGRYGWATAAAALLVCIGLLFVQHDAQQASYESASLVTEVCDQHIATLAANSPPQVISSDRHTVKPWFQGKIAFSFGLPENLPADTTLDGANLAYLHNQPAAQLLYSVGKHRVSVFIQQRTGATGSNRLLADHSGFHVTGFQTADLEVVAVSDVEPTRLADLTNRIKQAQARDQAQRK